MNHSLLIQIAQALGYSVIKEGGLCQGFSLMYARAVCANDLDTFNKRFNKTSFFENKRGE